MTRIRKPVVPVAGGDVAAGAPPTFSIVIPTYQAAATVATAVDSALDQTFPAEEVIVVDDGSTDDLVAALGPYRSRITFIRQENRGGAGALNTGLRAASGVFVAVLDADDVFLPTRLEALAKLAIARPELDILATDAFFEREGVPVGRFNAENPFAVEEQRRAILERCFLFNPAVRRTHVVALGGWDESLRIGYDWDCWLRLILDGAPAGLVDEPLTRYRFSHTSLSASRAASLRERVTLLEKAAFNPSLRPEERPILARSLAKHRQRALLDEAYAALAEEWPDVRRRCLAVAFGSGFGFSTRIRAAAAGLMPSTARRRVQAGLVRQKDRFPSVDASP